MRRSGIHYFVSGRANRWVPSCWPHLSLLDAREACTQRKSSWKYERHTCGIGYWCLMQERGSFKPEMHGIRESEGLKFVKDITSLPNALTEHQLYLINFLLSLGSSQQEQKRWDFNINKRDHLTPRWLKPPQVARVRSVENVNSDVVWGEGDREAKPEPDYVVCFRFTASIFHFLWNAGDSESDGVLARHLRLYA